ncbi:hypothetical protein GCM10023185_13070 [Hymenobacter saemangeumensis]|uniref:Polyketide cyclase n=1 Tax=Hymenobacter saemangeumensis TaxID=1084522 RepID=A0ABP8I7D5_9BACT
MKNLKKLGLALLIIIALLTIAGFFLPRQVHVERSLTIKAAPAAIFTEINTVRSWPRWSPWHGLDPQMQVIYSGPPSGEGAGYSWTSANSNVGNGTLTVTRSQPFERIDISMDFDENGTATGSYLLRPAGQGTRLTWTMDTDLGANPLERYLGLFLDKLVGADFEKGLANLQKLVEAPAATAQR